MTFRDHFPNLPIPFRRCGSDCVEVLWSKLGGFIMNRRVFTLREAIQLLRRRMGADAIGAHYGIQTQTRRYRGQYSKWEEPEIERAGPQVPTFSDDEIKVAWTRGVDGART